MILEENALQVEYYLLICTYQNNISTFVNNTLYIIHIIQIGSNYT